MRSHFWHIPGVANISTGSHTIQTTYGDALKKLGQGGIDPPVSLKSDKSSSVITSLVRLRGGATGTVRGGATGTARGGGIGTALGGGREQSREWEIPRVLAHLCITPNMHYIQDVV